MVRRKLSSLSGTNEEHALMYHLEEENAQQGASAAVSCCLYFLFKIRSTAKWLVMEGHEPRPHP